MPNPPPESASGPAASDFSGIIRRYAHDARNHLNGMELSTTLIGELGGEDPDIADAVGQLRKSLAQLEAGMRALVFKFTAPVPGPVSASDLMGLWKDRMEPLMDSRQAIQWNTAAAGAEMLSLDREAVLAGLADLTLAASKRPGALDCRVAIGPDSGAVILELREPPHAQGLPRELIAEFTHFFERQGGRLEYAQDPGTREWCSSITFPADDARGGDPSRKVR